MRKKTYILIDDKFLIGPFPSEERAAAWAESNSHGTWKKLVSYGPAEYVLSDEPDEE